ncbi:MAG TPA: YeeE/YedE thiosulfate transporter family protein [Thermodesulfovibrionales bacterium]|nr:YeeE/YedE thiosulfate transporter family protein [Thermodesulfovibrionales bacterium]
MGGAGETGVFVTILKDAYARTFYKKWPAWLGGLLIGITSVITFAWARPWGVVGGLREWIDWLFYFLGIYSSHPYYGPLLSSSSVLTFGLLWGAFASALLSKEFTFKIAPPFELIRGAMGGILMGIGTTMAAGCNVGGFFSAASALSLSGVAMMAGLIIGVNLEIRYVCWELEHFHFKRGDGKLRKPKEGSIDWKRRQPLFGSLAVIAAFAGAYVYLSCGDDAASGHDYVQTGGLLILGLVFGIIVHRSRFAFLQGFREPFATGNADQSRAMVVAVIVSVLGFAALKAGGLRSEWAYVTPTFWFGSFVGGIVFGFGMPFAGGCGSGACWRSAEGGIKQLVAIIFLGISNSVSQSFVSSSETLTSIMGRRVFLPHYLSYHWSIVLIISIMLVYYLVVSWNEKTRAFV